MESARFGTWEGLTLDLWTDWGVRCWETVPQKGTWGSWLMQSWICVSKVQVARRAIHVLGHIRNSIILDILRQLTLPAECGVWDVWTRWFPEVPPNFTSPEILWFYELKSPSSRKQHDSDSDFKGTEVNLGNRMPFPEVKSKQGNMFLRTRFTTPYKLGHSWRSSFPIGKSKQFSPLKKGTKLIIPSHWEESNMNWENKKRTSSIWASVWFLCGKK